MKRKEEILIAATKESLLSGVLMLSSSLFEGERDMKFSSIGLRVELEFIVFLVSYSCCLSLGL